MENERAIEQREMLMDLVEVLEEKTKIPMLLWMMVSITFIFKKIDMPMEDGEEYEENSGMFENQEGSDYD